MFESQEQQDFNKLDGINLASFFLQVCEHMGNDAMDKKITNLERRMEIIDRKLDLLIQKIEEEKEWHN